MYRYEPERGPVPAVNGASTDDPRVVPGRVLLALAQDDYSDASIAAGARQLMGALIDQRLDHQTLHSRTVFRALQDL
jgi:recombinational DNA repair protein (RecF pathway)